jgi:hypothetical protein
MKMFLIDPEVEMINEINDWCRKMSEIHSDAPASVYFTHYYMYPHPQLGQMHNIYVDLGSKLHDPDSYFNLFGDPEPLRAWLHEFDRGGCGRDRKAWLALCAACPNPLHPEASELIEMIENVGSSLSRMLFDVVDRTCLLCPDTFPVLREKNAHLRVCPTCQQKAAWRAA